MTMPLPDVTGLGSLWRFAAECLVNEIGCSTPVKLHPNTKYFTRVSLLNRHACRMDRIRRKKSSVWRFHC